MSPQPTRHADALLANTRTLGRVRSAVRWVVLAGAVALVWSIVPWDSGPRVLVATSPLVGIASALATRTLAITLLPALVALTLVLRWRRWLCRWACPTGLLADQAGRLGLAAGCRATRLPSIGSWIAGLTLAGAVFGYPLVVWLDPLALFADAFGVRARELATAAGWISLAGMGLVLAISFAMPGAWCTRLCPLGAFQDGVAHLHRAFRPGKAEADHAPWSLGRRVLVMGGLGAAVAVWLRRTQARPERTPPLRPPGALDDSQFAGVCVRCGNCVRACPTHILRPDLGTAGLAGLMAPIVRFDDGYCLEDCTRCGQVCPSGAIRPCALADKPKARIGLAQVDTELCLLGQNRECSICQNACPYQAIATAWDETTYMPVLKVAAERCPGCGACEAACPTAPRKAIRVVPCPAPIHPGGLSMNRAERAADQFAKGCSCSQAVLSAFAEDFGLDQGTALRLAAAFGGGMGRTGQTCGTVTAALMVLGLRFGSATPTNGEAREKTYQQARTFFERFRAQNGSTDCRDLLGCDLSTPEGLESARRNNLFRTLCPKYVRSAAEILDAMLSEPSAT